MISSDLTWNKRYIVELTKNMKLDFENNTKTNPLLFVS